MIWCLNMFKISTCHIHFFLLILFIDFMGIQSNTTIFFFGKWSTISTASVFDDPEPELDVRHIQHSMDWLSWENLEETLWFLHVFTIKLIGVSCKFSHHPVIWTTYPAIKLFISIYFNQLLLTNFFRLILFFCLVFHNSAHQLQSQ